MPDIFDRITIPKRVAAVPEPIVEPPAPSRPLPPHPIRTDSSKRDAPRERSIDPIDAAIAKSTAQIEGALGRLEQERAPKRRSPLRPILFSPLRPTMLDPKPTELEVSGIRTVTNTVHSVGGLQQMAADFTGSKTLQAKARQKRMTTAGIKALFPRSSDQDVVTKYLADVGEASLPFAVQMVVGITASVVSGGNPAVATAGFMIPALAQVAGSQYLESKSHFQSKGISETRAADRALEEVANAVIIEGLTNLIPAKIFFGPVKKQAGSLIKKFAKRVATGFAGEATQEMSAQFLTDLSNGVQRAASENDHELLDQMKQPGYWKALGRAGLVAGPLGGAGGAVTFSSAVLQTDDGIEKAIEAQPEVTDRIAEKETPTRSDVQPILGPNEHLNTKERKELARKILAAKARTKQEGQQRAVETARKRESRSQSFTPNIPFTLSGVGDVFVLSMAGDNDGNVTVRYRTRGGKRGESEVSFSTAQQILSGQTAQEGQVTEQEAQVEEVQQDTATETVEAQATEEATRATEGVGEAATPPVEGAAEAVAEEVSESVSNADPSKPSPRRGVISFGPLDALKKFTKRNFTSKGDLPQEVFDSNINRDSNINAEMRQVVFTLRDFKRQAKKAYGKQPNAQQLREIDSVLKGEKPIDSLPEPMREVVTRMRNHIDTLSHELLDSGLIEGPLAAVIEANIGYYATRSYRVFSDPKWAEKVPRDIRNKAKALLRSEYREMIAGEYAEQNNITTEEALEQINRPDSEANKFFEQRIEGIIGKLLYEGKAADSPIGLILQSKLGSKDFSILTKRKAIPPEIRALWGEFRDPRINFARSIQKMGQLISNHQFLHQVRQDGLGKFLFEEPITNEDGAFVKRIAADESSVMHPLNGLYTTPEIATEFETYFKPQNLPKWLSLYMTVNGVVKYSKTVGSLMTHIRNLIGNTGFATAQGHWRAAKMEDAFKGVMADLGGRNDTQWRDYVLKAKRLGVIHESARAGELRDVIKDAGEQDIDDFDFTAAQKLRRAPLRAITSLYRAEDDLWKLYGWENEKARYRKAYPEWTEDQVERHTASIIRNVYPTYSLVSRGVKWFRRAPVFGTFVSFPAEVFRTTWNTLNLIKTELSDPKTRTIGTQRAAGSLAAASLVPAAAMASKLLLGITDDEDEATREFLPPWSKNSNIVYLGRTPDGSIRYIDLSYTDPFEYLRTPIIALMRGESWTEKVIDAAVEAGEPFFGEEILFERVVDLMRNTKKRGGTVWNPEDEPHQQLMDMAIHLGEALEPGTITSMRRIAKGIGNKTNLYGKDYDPVLEATAVFTGHRLSVLDPVQGLTFKAFEHDRAVRDSLSILRRVATRTGSVSDEELRSAHKSMERARREAFDEMSKIYDAAIKLGVSADVIKDRLLAGGLSRKDVTMVATKDYVPYRPTNRYMESAIARAKDAGASDELKRRRDEILKLALPLTKED